MTCWLIYARRLFFASDAPGWRGRLLARSMMMFPLFFC